MRLLNRHVRIETNILMLIPTKSFSWITLSIDLCHDIHQQKILITKLFCIYESLFITVSKWRTMRDF